MRKLDRVSSYPRHFEISNEGYNRKLFQVVKHSPPWRRSLSSLYMIIQRVLLYLNKTRNVLPLPYISKGLRRYSLNLIICHRSTESILSADKLSSMCLKLIRRCLISLISFVQCMTIRGEDVWVMCLKA